jgi:hypothetical protein
MKNSKVLVGLLFVVVLLGLIGISLQAYFWQDFGRPLTQEEVEKRELDLKYQEKQSHLEQKKTDTAEHARKKQRDLNYEKSRLELKHKKDRLKVER